MVIWDTPPELWRGLKLADSSWHGLVASLHITARSGEPMTSVAELRAIPDRGFEGDRFFHASWSSVGRPDKAVTLIEEESLVAAAAELKTEVIPRDIRRNIVTRGVPLIQLLNREFTVGGVAMRGLRLFEPCMPMEKLSGIPGICRALVHRGGLKATILIEGVVRVGDPIALRGETPATLLPSD
ncbi:MAG: MOSC domain-containing protein [Deltaproteobacteria bacterium]|nr:MOSC domain-containing protein [Deltaproteobacteria bacterium]